MKTKIAFILLILFPLLSIGQIYEKKINEIEYGIKLDNYGFSIGVINKSNHDLTIAANSILVKTDRGDYIPCKIMQPVLQNITGTSGVPVSSIIIKKGAKGLYPMMDCTMNALKIIEEPTLIKVGDDVVYSNKSLLKNINHPSFDCSKAKSNDEVLICSDYELSILDKQFSKLYFKARDQAIDKKSFQKSNKAEWQWRQKVCSDKECLLKWYHRRNKQLQDSLNITNKSSNMVGSNDEESKDENKNYDGKVLVKRGSEIGLYIPESLDKFIDFYKNNPKCQREYSNNDKENLQTCINQ